MVINDELAPRFRSAAAILREKMDDPNGLVLCPGVYDGYTARIALSADFDALYMTGAGTAASVLGMPDLALVTLPEMAGNAGMIASLDRDVPVIADADTGFGSSLSVARAVQAYITNNVAAMHIEDQAFTKRCGHLQNKQLVSLDEYLVRLRAASKARAESGRDIVLIARTDSLQLHGFEEAIRRLKAAHEAGADVAFLEGLLNKDQAREAVKRLAPMPCLLNIVSGGVTPAFTVEEAKEMGFKIVIWSVLSLAYVYKAVSESFRSLKRDGYVEPLPGGVGSIKDIFGVCGIDKYTEFDRSVGGMAFQGALFKDA